MNLTVTCKSDTAYGYSRHKRWRWSWDFSNIINRFLNDQGFLLGVGLSPFYLRVWMGDRLKLTFKTHRWKLLEMYAGPQISILWSVLVHLGGSWTISIYLPRKSVCKTINWTIFKVISRRKNRIEFYTFDVKLMSMLCSFVVVYAKFKDCAHGLPPPREHIYRECNLVYHQPVFDFSFLASSKARQKSTLITQNHNELSHFPTNMQN